MYGESFGIARFENASPCEGAFDPGLDGPYGSSSSGGGTARFAFALAVEGGSTGGATDGTASAVVSRAPLLAGARRVARPFTAPVDPASTPVAGAATVGGATGATTTLLATAGGSADAAVVLVFSFFSGDRHATRSSKLAIRNCTGGDGCKERSAVQGSRRWS